MSIEGTVPAEIVPVLLACADGVYHMLQAGQSYRVGRDADCEIVISDPRVSAVHATVQVAGEHWQLADAGSTNGTFQGLDRVQEVELRGSCEVRLSDPLSGPMLSFELLAASATRAAGTQPLQPSDVDRAPSAVMPLPALVLRIGRALDNDLVIADLGVSRHHAELRRVPDGYEVVDLDSHNGTFVNGQRVASRAVSDGDIVSVGNTTYRLAGSELQQFVDTGEVSLIARNLVVRLPNGKVILDNVSFPLGERCLVAVIGPSGAGKSTLLGALTGMRPATAGAVLYDGRDLYQNYAELRHRIGLVPQENILHAQLSARRALGFAAELRFPGDTSAAERQSRIDTVLSELALMQHGDTRTSSLSGGQQKRVNVALELLTRPSLLFLDEPTSGLDPGLDMSVMEMMAELAHDGRTVIVVTHSVANLDVCDRLLVLVPGGKVAFFGPPADGLRYFGQPGWAQVFRAFEAEPDRDWAGEFRRSALWDRYVAIADRESGRGSVRARWVPRSPRPQSRLAQLSTLVRRYAAVIGADRNYVAVIALLPVILGALVRVIPDPGGLTGRDNGNAIQVLLILIMGACLTGVANSVRELVKERAIYARERAAGLSVAAYLCSKLVVLGVISAAQAVILVILGLAGRPLPRHGAVLGSAPLAELALAMALLAAASMTVGLLISALVNTSDKTMPLMVVAVLVQVVLSGAVFRLNGKAGLQQVSWLSPSRWGLASSAATVNLNQVTPPPPGNTPDPLWQHTAHTWLLDMAIQAALALAAVVLTWLILSRRSPGRRR